MIKFCIIHQVPMNAVTEKCAICEDIRQEELNSTRYAREAEHDARTEGGEVVADKAEA